VSVESTGKYDVEVDGALGRVWVSGGDGRPIVIVASMLVLAESYRWLVEAMKGFRVIVVEMPGSGRAEKLKRRAWSFAQYAQWLGAFLAQHGLGDATVVGHSNSAAAVMIAAARGDVRRTVLVDSVGAYRMNLLGVIFGRGIDAIIEWRLTLWGFHHVLVNLFRHWRNFWNQVRLSGASDLRKAASTIGVPTLVAWGGRDHTVGTRGQQILSELIANAQTHVCGEGSHDWLLAHLVEFVQVLREFACKAAANEGKFVA